ncbi:peptidylprolyl isomerase [Candidatus Pacearchaeota archaeon]|nr:peptidylprolyl isomerase [Candidatus Pacearchaeota archaeon]
MVLKKKDFIEIEFTGRIKDGEIFDSNIKEDLPENSNAEQIKPLKFCLGEGMFLDGVDDFLIGKDVGEYELELTPEKAFGHRDSKMVKMIPMKVFMQQKINPVPGVMFNFDGRMAKILTVSGGRVMVDFNNPIAGKIVEYKIKVLRKIEKQEEKVKALNDFLFRKDFKFEIRQEDKSSSSSASTQSVKRKNKKLIMEVEKPMIQFVEMFKDKFKEIFGLELQIKEIEEKKKQDKKAQ